VHIATRSGTAHRWDVWADATSVIVPHRGHGAVTFCDAPLDFNADPAILPPIHFRAAIAAAEPLRSRRREKVRTVAVCGVAAARSAA